MPRYYCDYCDTYLTHDSPSVRKQHNSGYKHKANIRTYYQKFEEEQTQTLLDLKIKQHLGQAIAYNQIGAAYNQHLAAYPGGPPRIPPPMMPLPPGPVPQYMTPSFRPPLMQMHAPGVPGYGTAPMVRPVPMHPMFPQQQMNGVQAPSTSVPSPTAGVGPTPNSNGSSTQEHDANPAALAPGPYAYAQVSQPSH